MLILYLQQQGFFVEPTIAAVAPTCPCLQEEVFAPIMYVVKVGSLEEAIVLNNAVPQGLSSALFTRDPEAIFKWTGACCVVGQRGIRGYLRVCLLTDRLNCYCIYLGTRTHTHTTCRAGGVGLRHRQRKYRNERRRDRYAPTRSWSA